jgi:HEPN domain-containing protein
MEFNNINIKLSKKFIKRSEEDLKVAELLLKNKDYADSTYHSQQVGEKSGKALLILEGKFVRDHIVSYLLQKLKIKEINEIVIKTKNLEKHWIKPRYPIPFDEKIWDPLEEYNEKIAREALTNAKFVLDSIKKILKEKYNLELENEK